MSCSLDVLQSKLQGATHDVQIYFRSLFVYKDYFISEDLSYTVISWNLNIFVLFFSRRFLLLGIPRHQFRLLGTDVVHQLLVLHEGLLAEVAGPRLARLVGRQNARRVRRRGRR